jgi:hypothetical protein
MPPRGAVAAAPGAEGQAQQPAAGGSFLSTVLRMAVMWYMFNMFKGGGQQTGGAANVMIKPLFPRGELFDVRVFLSESPALDSTADGTLIWEEPMVGIGTTTERTLTYNYKPSKVRGGRGRLFERRAKRGGAAVESTRSVSQRMPHPSPRRHLQSPHPHPPHPPRRPSRTTAPSTCTPCLPPRGPTPRPRTRCRRAACSPKASVSSTHVT